MSGRLIESVPLLLFSAGVLLVSGMRTQHVTQPRQPMVTLPTTFADQAGSDVKVSAEEQRIAGMTDYMMRTFGPDSAVSFTTYVGYYNRQVQGQSIHSPKNCLPGAGWDILLSERVTLLSDPNSPRVNRVLLANKGVRALVYYWYQGRGRIQASEYAVKWDLLRDAARFGRTEEALVRVVVPVGKMRGQPTGTDPMVMRADSLARTVAKQLATAVDGVLPVFPGVQ